MNEEEKLPKRKPTRASGFDYSNGGAYFLTICTDKRKKILSHISPGVPQAEELRVGGSCVGVPQAEELRVGGSRVGDDALGVPTLTLSDYGKIVEKYILSTENIRGVCVDNYVIMPNHIHLIISIDADGTPRASSPTRQTSTVSGCVSSLKRFVNKEIGKNIFQRSFYDHIIRSRKEYDEIYNYIQLNPQNWEKDELYTEEDLGKE